VHVEADERVAPQGTDSIFAEVDGGFDTQLSLCTHEVTKRATQPRARSSGTQPDALEIHEQRENDRQKAGSEAADPRNSSAAGGAASSC
jgi:hypothetical protein